jgi:hypothetical protein
MAVDEVDLPGGTPKDKQNRRRHISGRRRLHYPRHHNQSLQHKLNSTIHTMEVVASLAEWYHDLECW